jgi:tellurite resistance protein TerC
VTTDPFLVFTSNVFAILGLRSWYFALVGLLDKLRYLNTSIAAVLVVVGGKMLASSWLTHTLGSRANVYLLCTVVAILATGVVASLLSNRAREDAR